MKKPLLLLFATVISATVATGAEMPEVPSGRSPAAPGVAGGGVPGKERGQPAKGNLTHEQIDAAKQATALVVAPGGSGTAFCISESGLFITCKQVVERVKAEGLFIVVNPAGKEEKKYAATVLRTIPESNLAILKVDLDPKIPVLKLGDDETLFEMQPVYVTGYPFGVMLAQDRKSFPAISVNTGRVTSLRKKGGVLDMIQVDALLNIGNSGGPVLNEKGEVVGIVSWGMAGAGMGGSGMNVVIPVSRLKKEMGVPLVSVQTPEVKYEKQFEPIDVTVAVDWLTPPTGAGAVSLEITSGGETRRVDAVKGVDGKYHASVSPRVAKPAGIKAKLRVAMEFENGVMTCEVEDFPVTVQGKPRMLSQMGSITPAEKPGEFLVDGVPAGALPELAHMNVNMGGAMTVLNAQKAKRIGITVPNQDNGLVNYKVTVAAEKKGNRWLPWKEK